VDGQRWQNGFFNGKRGLEFPLQLLTIGTAVGIMGPGDYSLDHAPGIALPEVTLFLILAAVAIVIDLIGLALARQPATPAQPSSPAAS
jgi:hypothetical protein